MTSSTRRPIKAPKAVAAPAFPPPPDLPVPPPFGWVISPTRLTGNEAEQIKAACGLDPFVDAEKGGVLLAGHVAVAYARRLDPEAYPWDVAGRIPIGEFRRRFPDEDSLEETLAKTMADAIEAGEEAPDPT